MDMSAVESEKASSLQYPRTTIERADRCLRCSPFTFALFGRMRVERVELGAIASDAGVQNGYTRSPLSELAVENYLLWSIQVGILRREVDGQGITDSFRLTPLGRQLVEKWEALGGWSPPKLSDRLYNSINRWFRFPF